MGFVVFATFKAWVNDPNTSDADLQTCLDVAEGVVINHLGYNPASSSRTEYVNGLGLPFLTLRCKNITAITSITVDGVAINAALVRIDGDAIIYVDGVTTFPKGRGNIVVVYTGGWAVTPTMAIPTIILHTTMRIGNIVRMDKIANGQATINTPDGGTRSYAQYLKFDQQLAVLGGYRAEAYA